MLAISAAEKCIQPDSNREHVVDLREGREQERQQWGVCRKERGGRAEENTWPSHRDSTVNYNLRHAPCWILKEMQVGEIRTPTARAPHT